MSESQEQEILLPSKIPEMDEGSTTSSKNYKGTEISYMLPRPSSDRSLKKKRKQSKTARSNSLPVESDPFLPKRLVKSSSNDKLERKRLGKSNSGDNLGKMSFKKSPGSALRKRLGKSNSNDKLERKLSREDSIRSISSSKSVSSRTKLSSIIPRTSSDIMRCNSVPTPSAVVSDPFVPKKVVRRNSNDSLRKRVGRSNSGDNLGKMSSKKSPGGSLRRRLGRSNSNDKLERKLSREDSTKSNGSTKSERLGAPTVSSFKLSRNDSTKSNSSTAPKMSTFKLSRSDSIRSNISTKSDIASDPFLPKKVVRRNSNDSLRKRVGRSNSGDNLGKMRVGRSNSGDNLGKMRVGRSNSGDNLGKMSSKRSPGGSLRKRLGKSNSNDKLERRLLREDSIMSTSSTKSDKLRPTKLASINKESDDIKRSKSDTSVPRKRGVGKSKSMNEKLDKKPPSRKKISATASFSGTFSAKKISRRDGIEKLRATRVRKAEESKAVLDTLAASLRTIESLNSSSVTDQSNGSTRKVHFNKDVHVQLVDHSEAESKDIWFTNLEITRHRKREQKVNRNCRKAPNLDLEGMFTVKERGDRTSRILRAYEAVFDMQMVNKKEKELEDAIGIFHGGMYGQGLENSHEIALAEECRLVTAGAAESAILRARHLESHVKVLWTSPSENKDDCSAAAQDTAPRIPRRSGSNRGGQVPVLGTANNMNRRGCEMLLAAH